MFFKNYFFLKNNKTGSRIRHAVCNTSNGIMKIEALLYGSRLSEFDIIQKSFA